MLGLDRRIGLLFGGFVLVFAVALLRASYIQVVRGSALSEQAANQQLAEIPVPARRGAIVDRNGHTLAVSQESKTIYLTPYQLNSDGKQVEVLARILDQDPSQILDAISAGTPGYAAIAHEVDLRTAKRIEALDYEGVGSTPDSHRYYLQGALASQVLGIVNGEDQGVAGLEASYDDQLAGSAGEVEVTNDAIGRTVKRNVLTEATTGARLKLTIDSDIQQRAEEVLAGIGATYLPTGASAIVMDARNSEVLAMASWSPEASADGSEGDSWESMQNLATSSIYEPGSTFKSFTVAAAMQEGLVTPETSFNLAPSIVVGDRTIEESHARESATLTTADILRTSSNVGAVTIGLMLGSDGVTFDKWVRRFGFGTATGVELPGEETGLVIAPEDYSGSTMGNLPIGQGLAVTPLQMARGYAAIANGGILRRPQLVLRDASGRVAADDGKRVISRQTSSEMAKMLEGVFEEGGTAAGVTVPGYTLAGKTGTAQKVVNGVYSETEYVASFIGFAPANDPRIVVSVVVDDPSVGSYYGGTVAAPAFGELVGFTLPYLGVRSG